MTQEKLDPPQVHPVLSQPGTTFVPEVMPMEIPIQLLPWVGDFGQDQQSLPGRPEALGVLALD